jgi:hypothetical protein
VNKLSQGSSYPSRDTNRTLRKLSDAKDVRFSLVPSVQRLITGWTTGVRFPVGARSFLFAPVSNCPQDHTAAYPMGSNGCLPGVKAAGV